MKDSNSLKMTNSKSLKTHKLVNIFLTLSLLSSPKLFGQSYDAPYDIPRFQDFISGSKLQAPNSGTAATQSELINGYTDDSFYVVDTTKVAFNQSGASKRTELRHLTNWTLGAEDRSLHGKIKVVEQTCDQVTLLQIHDDANAGNGPNKPLLRVYKHLAKNPTNHIWAAIKTDVGGSNTTHIDLGLAPSDYFNCDIKLVGGNMIIDIDGVEKVNMDVSFWTFPSYWKAGVYLQDTGEATAYFDELYLGSGSTTSIPRSLDENMLAVFPNPNQGLLALNINLQKETLVNAKVAAIDGRVLKIVYNKSLSIGQHEIELDLTDYKTGIYILEIEIGGIRTMKKIVKQ